MAPSSQELEPPENPGQFNAAGSILVGDAGGVRSIFYAKDTSDSVLVASHAAILAELLGSPLNWFAKGNIQILGTGYRTRNWPGRTTRYEGIFELTPNLCLDLDEFRCFRFFCCDPLPELTVDEAVSVASSQIANMATSLSRHYSDVGRELVIMLTAGVDSRVALAAACASSQKPIALTYKIDSVHGGDIEIAQRLSNTLGLKHLILQKKGEARPEVRTWARRNASNVYSGSTFVIESCASKFGGDAIAMRGNLGEISRGVFLGRVAFLNEPARFMARIWFRGSERNPKVMAAFEDFCEEGEFHKVRWPLRIVYYWEHKHATWHAGTANEMDAAFDTFNVMNSRRVIEAMCGVDQASQVRGDVHRGVIRALAPELAEFEFQSN